MKNNNKSPGFTLLELVIIVAIIALIVQFGTVSYRAHVLKSSRLNRKMLLYHVQLSDNACKMPFQGADACEPLRYDGLTVKYHNQAWSLRPQAQHPDYADKQCFEWWLDAKHQWKVYADAGYETTADCI